MPSLAPRWAFGLALVAGAGLWVGTTALSGRREAWDASIYWSATYPLAILVAGLLGYLSTERPWRWGLTLMLAQGVAMAVISSDFGLLPLGLLMFAALAVPPMVVARLAAGVRTGRATHLRPPGI